MTVYEPKEGIEASVKVDVLASFKEIDAPLPYLRLDIKRNNAKVSTITTDGNGRASSKVTFAESGTHRIEAAPSDAEEFRGKLGSDLIAMPYASQTVNVASVKPEAMIQCSREITKFPVLLNDKSFHSGDTVLFPVLGDATYVKAEFPKQASGVYALQPEVVERSISSDTIIIVPYNAPSQMLLSLSASPGKSVEGNVDVQVKGICGEPFEGVPINMNGVDARTGSNGSASIPFRLSSAGVFTFGGITKTPISVANSVPLTILSVRPQAFVECSKEAVSLPLKVNGDPYASDDIILFPLPALGKQDLKLEYPEVSNNMYTKTPTISMSVDKNVTPFALYNAPRQIPFQVELEKACAFADEVIKGSLSAKVLDVCGNGFPNIPIIDMNGTEYMTDSLGRLSVPFSVKGPGTYNFKLTTKTPVSISESKSITMPTCVPPPKQILLQAEVEKACAWTDEVIKGTLSARVLDDVGGGIPSIPVDMNGTEYMTDGLGRLSVPFSVKGPGTYNFKLTTKTPVSISESKSITVPACTAPIEPLVQIGDVVSVEGLGTGGVIDTRYDPTRATWMDRVYQNNPFFDQWVLEREIRYKIVGGNFWLIRCSDCGVDTRPKGGTEVCDCLYPNR